MKTSQFVEVSLAGLLSIRIPCAPRSVDQIIVDVGVEELVPGAHPDIPYEGAFRVQQVRYMIIGEPTAGVRGMELPCAQGQERRRGRWRVGRSDAAFIPDLGKNISRDRPVLRVPYSSAPANASQLAWCRGNAGESVCSLRRLVRPTVSYLNTFGRCCASAQVSAANG